MNRTRQTRHTGPQPRRRHSRGSRRGGGWLALALLAGPGLSACAGLPSSSPVRQGLGVNGPEADPVRMLPNGPSPDASRVEVVRGLLRAEAGFDDEHAVARSFLTPRLARSWRPGDEVSVLRDSSVRLTPRGERQVRLDASIVATIDPDGRYHDLQRSRSRSITFDLERVGGQWRIGQVPGQFGLWLSTSDLDRLYRPYAIYYVSPAAKVLIPDVRWLPIDPGLATSLARAQLAPVPEYLRGAVRSSVDPGTALHVDAVPVQGGVATVDLATTQLTADPGLRQALWAQFVATLVQAPSVLQVSLEAGGNTVDLPGMRSYPSVPGDVGYAYSGGADGERSTVRRDRGQLQRLGGAGLAVSGNGDGADQAKAAAPPLPTIAEGWTGLALSSDGVRIAGVGGDRADLALWRGTALTVAPRFATALTRPSFDARGWLWTAAVPLTARGERDEARRRTAATTLPTRAAPAGTSAVVVLDTRAKDGSLTPVAVSAPWLAGRRVLALRVSPDDQRVALLTRRTDGSDLQVQVSGVVRGSDGRPRSLDAPLRVGWSLVDGSDLCWIDDRTLGVLGQVSGSTRHQPLLVDIGAGVTPLAEVAGARWITTTGGARGILVVTDGAQVYERAGAGWVVQGRASDVAVAGG